MYGLKYTKKVKGHLLYYYIYYILHGHSDPLGKHGIAIQQGPQELPILFWGSLLQLWYTGPPNPILITKVPIL